MFADIIHLFVLARKYVKKQEKILKCIFLPELRKRICSSRLVSKIESTKL